MTGTQQPSDLGLVRDYVCAVLTCAPDRISAVTRFEDGNRHAVYRVSYRDASGGTEDVVVRVSYEGDPTERARAEREAVVLEMVGGVAGPSMYDFRQSSRWFDTPAMCMQYVPGSHRQLDSAGPAEIAELGSVMAWVHAHQADQLTEGHATRDSIVSYAAGRLQSIMSGLGWVRAPMPAPMR